MILDEAITLAVLDNPIQNYAWGSRTAIAELLGNRAPAADPQAEMWMGAHHLAASNVRLSGASISLRALIQEKPMALLGARTVRKFGPQLPFLFKVLAAARPLSIQAHPGVTQARHGFQRENDLDIPLDAPNRNYRDDNPKPECLCALSAFSMLLDFRPRSQIVAYLEAACARKGRELIARLRLAEGPRGVKYFFETLLNLPPVDKSALVAEAVQNAHTFRLKDPVFDWVLRLHRTHGDDTGVLGPLFMNLIRLHPGQSLYLPAGRLHAYLEGTGIELMANSDNVVRGGLTPKHIDIPELLQILDFETRSVTPLIPVPISRHEIQFPSTASEFILSAVSLERGQTYISPRPHGIEILLCTQGRATIMDPVTKTRIELRPGVSVLVPAIVEGYKIGGAARLYKAAVP